MVMVLAKGRRRRQNKKEFMKMGGKGVELIKGRRRRRQIRQRIQEDKLYKEFKKMGGVIGKD